LAEASKRLEAFPVGTAIRIKDDDGGRRIGAQLFTGEGQRETLAAASRVVTLDHVDAEAARNSSGVVTAVVGDHQDREVGAGRRGQRAQGPADNPFFIMGGQDDDRPADRSLATALRKARQAKRHFGNEKQVN
jgi:hypothetical protein